MVVSGSSSGSGSCSDWSRNSLPLHARLRAAAHGSRPGEEVESEEDDGVDDKDADEAQALPGIGRGGGWPRQSQEAKGLLLHPVLPNPFFSRPKI